jgi:hypothetical protein
VRRKERTGKKLKIKDCEIRDRQHKKNYHEYDSQYIDREFRFKKAARKVCYVV